MTKVFLNYRVTDEPFGVVLLDRELSRRFGSEEVFLASKSIPLGADWERRMFQAVEQSAALLVVMGVDWLGEQRPDGSRRLNDPGDFVRREILTAAALGKVIVPVRFNSERIDRAEFPDELSWLAKLQDSEVRFRSVERDLDHLANRLAAEVKGLSVRLPRVAGGTTFTMSGTADNVVQAERIDISGDFHAGPRYGRSRRTS